MALDRRVIQESWLILKDHLLQAQERFVPTIRKSRNGGRDLHG